MFTNDNPVYVLTVLALMVVLSIYVAKTKWGKPLGAAFLVIVFTAVVAIFFLLLDANLKSIKKAGAPMIGLFLLGSLGTVLGILGAWYLVAPQTVLGDDGAVLAGMLTGTYTGGSVNFNAVALAYNFQEKGVLYAGSIAVDNVVTAIWVVVTIALPLFLRRFFKDKRLSVPESQKEMQQKDTMDLQTFALLLMLGLGAFLLSEYIAYLFPAIPSIITLSTLGIALAQTPFVAKLKGGQTLGLYLVYIFLAVIGAYCEIGAVIALKNVGLTLFLFTIIAVFFHGILMIVLGGFLYRDWDMVAIASQANVGGGTSAIALAETFNRKELILPAILVGTLGNALGTYLGFLVVSLL